MTILNANLHMSTSGIRVLQVEEGCKLVAYRGVDDVWTIGTGHTSAAGSPIVTEGMRIIQAQANAILAHDIIQYENQVKNLIRVVLNQAQFDALVDFVYNCGERTLQRSTFLAELNKGQYNVVPHELLQFDTSRGKMLSALRNRRQIEADMFSSGKYPNFVLHKARALVFGTWTRADQQALELAA